MSGTNTLISDSVLKMEGAVFGGLNILSCHTDHVQPEVNIRFHEHPYWELSFMLSGSMTTYCDEFRVLCREEVYELFLAPAGTIHRRVFGGAAENCNLTWIFTLSDTAAARVLTEKCRQNGYYFAVSGFLAELMRELRRRFPEEKRSSNQLMAHTAALFLLEFLKEYGGLTETEEHDQPFWSKLDVSEKADEIRGYMLAHIDNPDLNKKLTNQFKLSLRQLNRIFRRKWNCSMAEALDAIKVEQSRILLRNTEMTVREIAVRLGFVSRAGFYNFFRKHNNMTPAEFRSLQQNRERIE